MNYLISARYEKKEKTLYAISYIRRASYKNAARLITKILY